MRHFSLIFILFFLLRFLTYGQTNISGTINDYTEVTNIDVSSCSTIVSVNAPGAFNQGDRVMVIQMKGASINSTNNSNYGSVTNYGNAGNYEFATVTLVNGNMITLEAPLLNNYKLPGNVQLIRVPTYNSATVDQTLSAPSWNGATGGILVMEVSGNLTLNANIELTGKGFRGAGANLGNANCGETDYAFSLASGNGGRKGEGITAYTPPRQAGRGPLANGGGGGNSLNSGGAGGGNGGRGGSGGDQWTQCPGPNYDYGGNGGRSLIYTNAQNKVFLGGGGAAGHADDQTNQAISGTAGGGIVIIRANSISGNNQMIQANGIDQTNTASDDGVGGGGAGGAVLLEVSQFNGQLTIEANGGNGGDNDLSSANGCRGPGGGGGGGVIWTSTGGFPGNVTTSVDGGDHGVATNPSHPCGGPYGATNGQDGDILNNLDLPENTYSPPEATLAFSDTAICIGDSVQLAVSGGNNYQWAPSGSLNNASIANPIAKPDTQTTYRVAVSDGNCSDTAFVTVRLDSLPTANATPDTVICNGQSVQLQASGASSYSWQPALGLSNTNNATPIASPSSTLTYTVTVTDTDGCQDKDDVTVTVQPQPEAKPGPDKDICLNDTTQLMAVDNASSYVWRPASTLQDDSTLRPLVFPNSTTTYTLIATNQFGCKDSAQVNVNVRSLPVSSLRDDTTVYQGEPVDLETGGDSAVWTPDRNLSSPDDAAPVAKPQTTTLYGATIFNEFGCTTQDSVLITVETCDELALPSAFSPNDDGYNDTFGYLNDELDQLDVFAIYDRWGNRVFRTDELNVRWNGRHAEFNEPADAGVYVYVIKGRCNNQKVIKRGNVTLIR